MKQIIKIHENDVQTMIENASKRILKESFGIVETKKKSVVKLTENDVKMLAERTFKKVMEQHFL